MSVSLLSYIWIQKRVYIYQMMLQHGCYTLLPTLAKWWNFQLSRLSSTPLLPSSSPPSHSLSWWMTNFNTRGVVGSGFSSSRYIGGDNMHVVFAGYMAFVRPWNPLPVVPLVLKFGIHLKPARRKGVRGGEEEGSSGGCSYRFHHLARLGSSILPPCSNISWYERTYSPPSSIPIYI
jgi:hypothetical protein